MGTCIQKQLQPDPDCQEPKTRLGLPDVDDALLALHVRAYGAPGFTTGFGYITARSWVVVDELNSSYHSRYTIQ